MNNRFATKARRRSWLTTRTVGRHINFAGMSRVNHDGHQTFFVLISVATLRDSPCAKVCL